MKNGEGKIQDILVEKWVEKGINEVQKSKFTIKKHIQRD